MRIDAYMQVSQIYQTNKTKNAPKTGKAGSRDSLEISSFGNAYQVAKQAASQASDVREDKVTMMQGLVREAGEFRSGPVGVVDNKGNVLHFGTLPQYVPSLMEELIQTLDAEEKCYSQLIPIEEEKTRAIIANDLEALQDITVREHDLVDETSALENKRERVAIDIATVLGRDPKTITLEQIASVLKNQPADQKKLQEVHDRLRRTVSRLQELNNQNKQLLKEAIDMVEYNMNVIRSTRMSSGSSNYSSDASEVAGMAPQHGMFDAKQ